MYHYTISTWSQSLTVVQRIVSDLQSSKRLFIYMYYSGITQLDLSGRVCSCCCRLINIDTYVTCLMHAFSTLELRGGPDHAIAISLTLSALFIRYM